MTQDICQSIIVYLQQEIEWVSALNDLLLKEKEILEQNQFDQLNTVAEAKKTLSENLEKSSRQRVILMQLNPNNPQQHKAALDTFLQSLPSGQADSIRQLNEKLAHQLQICRERNSINGQVIATNLTTRKAIFDDLTSNATSDENQATYDSQGDVKKNPSSGNYQQV
ncbi:flagellar export chaperone FlgN [Legionella sp. W05-934-2]|jgi:flagella synthesis protein FlgN|uniref:flagellar export chaperone FlgN n=1 Tax=Legionella sp. W05-934-2 TaxID=1198649 RepID=UPI0034637431